MPTRSTHVTLLNKIRTNQALVLAEQHLDDGRWSIEPAPLVGDSDEWESESHGFVTGTEGSVTYIIPRGNEDDAGFGPSMQVHLHWNNPFLGDNSYDASVTPPGKTDGTGFSVGFFGAKRFDHNAEVTFVLLSGKCTVDENTGEIICSQASPGLKIAEAMPEQSDWRFCSSCSVIFFAGFDSKGVCPGGNGHKAAENSFNYVMQHEPELQTAQRDWRFCTKCGVLFFNGFPGKGVCPGGSGHEAAGFRYVIDHDIPESSTAQRDWRFCAKCGVMFFNGFAGKGICPGGGEHEAAAGFTYVLSHDIPESSTAQTAWRFCGKCGVLFFNGLPGKGVCPGGGAHEAAAGFAYVIQHEPELPTAQRDWRFCNKCGVMFFDGFPGKGVCPAGGGHELAGFAYLIQHDVPESTTAQPNWRFCKNCGVMFFDGFPGKGICPGGGGGHEAAKNSFLYVLSHDVPHA